MPGLEPADLEAFSGWLGNQADEEHFNVGCLFTVDAKQRVRVCLHPKMLHSKAQVGPLRENNMKEGNLLTVVTLRPTNKALQTVTVQPLLCSDALHLDTNRADSRPLEAMQRDAECLGDKPPDHVDIVSVATCTQQVEVSLSKGSTYRIWHQEFRNTFVRAASDDGLARHRFATFVLSNFRMIAHDPGGLSGAFVPAPVASSAFPDFVTISCWGRPKGSKEDNRWTIPGEDNFGPEHWSSRGYIASLSPFSEKAEAVARMFGFSVTRLPRDVSLWNKQPGLVSCTVKIGERRDDPASLVFSS